MSVLVFDWGRQAGIGPTYEEVQNQFAWGRRELSVLYGAQISGAARDAGSTPTTVLRSGLLMGQITGTKLWTNYSPTATDGSQVAAGVLAGPALRMVDVDGNNQNKAGVVIVGGPVLFDRVYNLDALARSQMYGRMLFSDDVAGVHIHWKREVPKTGNYGVLATDNNSLFTNTGAVGSVIFTLPARAAGLQYTFFVVADQSLSVASAAGSDMVTSNNASASSVGFATGGDKIGGCVRVTCNAAATKWYVEKLSPNALTIS